MAQNSKAEAAKEEIITKELSSDSPWKALDLQSDDEVTVEACAIVGYQSSKGALVRYRVDGDIIGKVEFLSGFQVKIKDGIWQLR